jgi:hypothetical protein
MMIHEGYSPGLKSLVSGSLAIFFHVRQRMPSRLSGDVGMRMRYSGDAPHGRLHFYMRLEADAAARLETCQASWQ